MAGIPDYCEGISGSTQNSVGLKTEGTRRKEKEGGEQVGQACIWGEGAEAQGSDPHIHGRPLEWGSHLKLLGVN